jgi:hypothetical protein
MALTDPPTRIQIWAPWMLKFLWDYTNKLQSESMEKKGKRGLDIETVWSRLLTPTFPVIRQLNFTLITTLLHSYCTPITPLLHSYCTPITPLLPPYCTPITPLLPPYCIPITPLLHLHYPLIAPL